MTSAMVSGVPKGPPWLSSQITISNVLIATAQPGRGTRKSKRNGTKKLRNAEPGEQRKLKTRMMIRRHSGLLPAGIAV